MIKYGTKTIMLSTSDSKTAVCNSCNASGTVQYFIYRKHIHISYIPIFPLRKSGFSQCKSCKNVSNEKEMRPDQQAEYKAFLKQAKGPKWQYSGLIIIALISVFASMYGVYQDQMDEEYLQSPLAGDKYTFSLDDEWYSLLKVVSVDSDSIYIVSNTMQVDDRYSMNKIDKEENYESEWVGYTIEDLQRLYKEGFISDVSRD